LSDVEMLVLAAGQPDVDESDTPAEDADRTGHPESDGSAAAEGCPQDTAA
jgi:hypothetical protein